MALWHNGVGSEIWVVALLLMVVVASIALGDRLRFVPSLVVCYFGGFLLSLAPTVVAETATTEFVCAQFPMLAITLSLLGSTLPALSLSRSASWLGLMAVGTASVWLGGIISAVLMQRLMAPDQAGVLAALAGAWIGGSANLTAVAGALELEPGETGLAVMMDSGIYLFWFPLLLGLRYIVYDRGQGQREATERVVTEPPAGQAGAVSGSLIASAGSAGVASALAIAMSVVALANLSEPLVRLLAWHGHEGMFRVLAAATLGALGSLLARGRWKDARRFGTWAIYFLVATLGAKTDLDGLDDAWILFAFAALWITAHGVLLLLLALVFGIRLELVVMSSAANIGGVGTAPIIADHYSPQLVPFVVMMAVLGDLCATPLAVALERLLRGVLG